MKTANAIPLTFSDSRTMNLYLPNNWKRLSDKNKLWIFSMLQKEKHSELEIKMLFLLRCTGIQVIEQNSYGWLCSCAENIFRNKYFYLKSWQVHHILKEFQFIFESPKEVVNIKQFGKLEAVNSELHGVPFSTYLVCENLYQSYILSKNSECLRLIATYLYTKKGKKPRKSAFSEPQLFAVFFWWYSLKNVFAMRFKHFFQSTGSDGKAPDMTAIMNAEIRALTGGDVTKEQTVFDFDTYRALTELNEKAREARELEQKMKK